MFLLARFELFAAYPAFQIGRCFSFSGGVFADDSLVSLSDIHFLFAVVFVVNDTEKEYHEPTSQLYLEFSIVAARPTHHYIDLDCHLNRCHGTC